MLRWDGTGARVGAGVATIVVVGAGVWWFAIRGTAPASAAPTTSTQAVAASLQTLERTVSASGTLSPTVQADADFAAPGTVTAVDVAAGDTVKAGQTLATIDTLSLNASLLSAKATLATDQARLADLRSASDGSASAVAQISAAEAQVSIDQQAVTTATSAMADATLVAPVAGLVTSVNLTTGQTVSGSSGSGSAGGSGSQGSAAQSSSSSSGQVVIIGTDSWKVDVTVDDADIAKIAVGDQVDLTVDGVTDPVFGTVASIGLIPSASSGVAAYPVEVDVTGKPAGLHDGVSVTASIVYERRTDVLTVPSEAVRTVNGTTYVLQADAEGAQVETPVTVGETVGTLTEITGGLSEGDQVLVTVVTPQTQNQSGTTRRQFGGTGEGGAGGFPGGFPGGGFGGRQGGSAGDAANRGSNG
jgi:macrolide-specific efflux system membrane fusion protein